MKLITYIIFFISISFALTDEQLERIRNKTNNTNLASNFTLKSLESRSFSDIKFVMKNLLEGCKIWKTTHKDFPIDIQNMINEEIINISESILKKWLFEIDIQLIINGGSSLEGTITATGLDEEYLKIIYDIKEDIFSFMTSSENNMSFDNNITLDSLRGKVVLINFWATWCGPCRLEIPDFNEIYNKYNEQGFEVLAISISDSREQLLKFKNAYNIFYPILYGNQSEMYKIQREYGGVYSIPQSFLIDKKGEVIRIYPGAILKQFDPSMYTDLIMNIENALLK